jgi:hypothetical protein
MTLIFKHPDDETLYEQLISRLYHIERAFMVRRHIKLHYSKAISNDVAKKYLIVRNKYDDFFSTYEETLLWFITVELWSRFLYSETKRGLFALVETTGDTDIKNKHLSLTEKHKEVIGYIKTQRNKYFAHADEVKWGELPNVWDKEYDLLITDLKDLMKDIGSVAESQMLPTSSNRAAEHTDMLFDDLLRVSASDIDVENLSAQFSKDVEKFVNE